MDSITVIIIIKLGFKQWSHAYQHHNIVLDPMRRESPTMNNDHSSVPTSPDWTRRGQTHTTGRTSLHRHPPDARTRDTLGGHSVCPVGVLLTPLSLSIWAWVCFSCVGEVCEPLHLAQQRCKNGSHPANTVILDAHKKKK